MENKRKAVIILISIILLCCLVFFGSAYLYLALNRKQNNSRAETKNSSVPYSASVPENAGLLFTFPDESSALFYMDFENTRMIAISVPKQPQSSVSYYGYTATYTVKADYPLITGIIDRIGGVELDLGQGTLRYTGVQITAALSDSTDNAVLKRSVIQAALQKISVSGFTRQDFVYIIGNSKTDLTVPDCYHWSDYLSELCKNVTFLGN